MATVDISLSSKERDVPDYLELDEKQNDVRGKIVLFNSPFTTYGETVQYRYKGASSAARYGAWASLIRSVGPYSMNTPHTGTSAYEDGVKKIPHAALTLEDAAMMGRMADRGLTIKVSLYMEGRFEDDVPSQNVMGEITGSEYDSRLDDKAEGMYNSQERAKIVTNGGQHADYENMRTDAIVSNTKMNSYASFLANFMSAIQAGKFGDDAKTWDVYTEWKAIQDKYTSP